LAAGLHAEAFTHLRRIFDPADAAYHPALRTQVLPELAEAAIYSGHADLGARIVDGVRALATPEGPPSLHIGLLVADPILAMAGEPENRFDAALAHGLIEWPLHRARLHLHYGAWLRRCRRAGEARAPLRLARDAFDALGAQTWSAWAARELRAAGEVVRSAPDRATWEQLTPQELRIASLAAEGMSNREIGELLYLSHRTVSSHLYRAFPKLGITGRVHLAQALAAVPQPTSRLA
jgi:DNA-binding CsgD family transcriptional regulator